MVAEAAGGRGAGRPTMNDLDADKDGKVTLTELAAYYRKNGFVPFQVQLAAPAANPFGGLAAFGGPRPEPVASRPSARRSSPCSTPTRTAS